MSYSVNHPRFVLFTDSSQPYGFVFRRSLRRGEKGVYILFQAQTRQSVGTGPSIHDTRSPLLTVAGEGHVGPQQPANDDKSLNAALTAMLTRTHGDPECWDMSNDADPTAGATSQWQGLECAAP